MSHPHIITDRKRTCNVCGSHDFYEQSMKCVHCCRKRAGIAASKSMYRKMNEEYYTGVPDKTPRIDTERERIVMEGVAYD